MSFQQSAFQSNAYQEDGGGAFVPPTVGNTIRGGVWELANNVIGRCLVLLLMMNL
jgi:hypothetical protein